MKLGLAIFLGTLSVAFVGGIARAQDAGTCSPACQEGEVCVGSTCMVPACRPPCGAGETCVSGTCMVPAVPPPARRAPPPPDTPPPPAVRPLPQFSDYSPILVPTVRKGAYVMALVGVSAFLEEEAVYLSPGLRAAVQAGGYVTNDVSLGGALTFDLMNWDVPPGNDAGGFMLEAAFAPLFHAGDATAEFIVGPAVGAWMSSIDVSDQLGGKASATAQGWSLGGNLGLLVPVWPGVRMGGIFNVMFRETLNVCATVNTMSRCSSTGPTHDVIGFSVVAMH